MSEPFLGEIRIFGFNFAPRGWAFCNGQLLSISQNTALFSLLGTTYGGNGQTTFALPNLQSRAPVHFGQGAGLSSYTLGQAAGEESVTLTSNQLAAHSHAVNATNGASDSNRPANRFPASGGAYAAAGDGTTMNPGVGAAAGGSQPHSNLPPYLALNFCIALVGIFPSRN